MAENRYNLGSRWSAKSQTNESLTLGAFNGRSQFTVWRSDRSKVFQCSLSPSGVCAIKSIIRKLLASKGEFKEPYRLQEWDRDSKSYKITEQLLFIRDNRGLINIELSGPNIKPAIVFNVKAEGYFNLGGDGLSAVDRANLSLEALLDQLNSAAVITALSTFNTPPPKRPNDRGDRRNNYNDRSSDNRDSGSEGDNDVLF